MAALKTNLKASDLPESLQALWLGIEQAIPVGFNQYRDPLDAIERHALRDEFEDLDARVHNPFGKARRQR